VTTPEVTEAIVATETKQNAPASATESSGTSIVLVSAIVVACIGLMAAALVVVDRRRRRHMNVSESGLVTPECIHPELLASNPGSSTPKLALVRVQQTIL
jgi:hypothetical protein